MKAEDRDRILTAFGNPAIKTEKVTLVFARQHLSDVDEIEKMTDETLIKEWKGLVWMNHIYGQVSLNELQRLSLIEAEFDVRPSIKTDELRDWFEKANKEYIREDE